MSRLLRPVLAVCLLLSALPVARSADPIRPKTTADLIRDLDDRDFKSRESATKKLWEIGEKARPQLEQVLKSGSLEAATRAQSVLDQLDWGIRADTPKPILERIQKFRTGDYNAQWSAVRWMIDNDEEAVPYLRILLRKVFAPYPSSGRDSRVEMFTAAGRSVRERVPILLYEKNADHAERLLELLTLGPIQEGNRDYAVYLSSRGRLKEGITRLEAAKGGANPMTAVYLYRAAGENQKAKAAVGELPIEPSTTYLYEALLADIGAWAELADRADLPSNSTDGLTAFRLRKAGKVREADKLLKALKESEHDPDARGFAMESGAVGLFLNGRTADGLDRLKGAESAPHVATDIHAARLDFTTALDLIKAGLATDNGTQQDGDEAQVNRQLHTLYKLKKARLLAQLGERDAAAQLFTSLADWSQRTDRNVQAQVVQAAVRSGFPDIAAELLGTIQAKRDEDGDGLSPSGLSDPYEAVFEADADPAKHWWAVLRRADPKKNPGEQMRAIRAMLTGKMPADQVREAIQTEAKQGTQPRSGPEPGGPGGRFPRASYRRPLALAAAYQSIGDTDKAISTLIEYVEQSSTTPRRRRPGVRDLEAVNAGQPEPAATRSWVFGLDESFRIWVDLGDLLSEQGKHEAAAKRLYEGWRLNPENPILLYLSGRALVKAGKADEGKRRIELAHIIPLGNAQMRGRFLEELITRGAVADMRVEIDRIRECAWAIDGSSVGNVWNQVGRASLVLKDYATAADAQQRAVHFILKTNGIVYVEGAAYVNVPCLVRGLQARDLLARGKNTEALAAADEALAMVPTHTDTIVGLVQMLDALGLNSDADALFRRGWDAYIAALRVYPKSASLKHSAAWLAAGCRRELDTAKKYSSEAVEAEPSHRGYRESLAEVSFRTGDRGKASQIMKQLAEEDRRSWHYKRQLERYKSGATDSALPVSDE